jgi:hypothetical protein
MELEEAINKLVRDITSTIINDSNFISIRAQQNAPRPSGSYASVHVTSDKSIGWEEFKTENEGEDVRISSSGMREIMISINFFRENAKDYARKVRNGFVRTTVNEILTAAGLGLTRRSDVRGLSSVVDTKWEQRAQFDLTLSAVGNDSELITTINAVTINGEFETGVSSIPIEIQVQ